MSKKKTIKLICPECGFIPKRNTKSNENFDVCDNKCPECGSPLIVDLEEEIVIENNEIEILDETEVEEIASEELIEKKEEAIALKNDEALAINEVTKDYREDFSYARTNIKDIIDIGMNATNNLADLARQTESARVYEALNSLLDVMGKNNMALLDIDKKFKDLIEGNDSDEENEFSNAKNITQNNIIFNGTTADLTKMIEDKIKGRT